MSASILRYNSTGITVKILILFFFLQLVHETGTLAAQHPPAELFLQIERKNRLKTVRLLPGDVFEIKLYSEKKNWTEVRLTDHDPLREMIITDYGSFHIGEIKALRTRGQKQWGSGLIGQTMNFTAGTLVLSLADLYYGNSYNWGFVGAAGGMLGLSFLVKWASRAFYYRFHRNHRLRIIDLRM